MAEKQPSTVKEVVKILAEVSTKLDDMNTKLSHEINTMNTKLGTELESVNRSMDFMNKNFEDFKKDLAAAVKEIKELRAEQDALKVENKRLADELCTVKKELLDLQQYSRTNNLEIKGLPQNPNEDLETLVAKLAGCAGVQVCPADIDVVHRVPSKTQGVQNVIVKFVRRSVRDEVLSKTKKRRLTSADLGFETSVPVYINEHLCLENKILLSKAIRCKKEKGWKLAWVSQSRIFMRKNETSDVILITSEDDLSKIA
ncbi:uncharacterized protein LOC120843908 [Ixodes scapularis]|uniref:uncharacterized protein LOC120843908 n=1 Tax=Ixodes scapularis TaxID=6945 RepID=UPI001A9D0E09|nr:uncharacterized protein LOC120843908 [Ixodes scapularis]